MNRLVIPNYHIVLIHFPLALLGLGLLIEVFSFMWKRSSFRLAGRWMILLGALLLVPAATSGTFALFDVANHGKEETTSWLATKAHSGLSDTDWHYVWTHVTNTAIGGGIALVAAIAWLGASDLWRRRLYFPCMLLLIGGMVMITRGAWNGGEMVFQQGFGVKDAKGVYDVPPAAKGTKEYYDQGISPRQVHVIAAGFVFALAALSIGLAFRKTSLGVELLVQRKPLGADLLDENNPLMPENERPLAVAPLLNEPDHGMVLSTLAAPVLAGRFWLRAALGALLTAVGGLYVSGMIGGNPLFDFNELKTAFQNYGQHERMVAHTVFGGSILILALVLAGLSRWGFRSRLMLSIFSSLLVMVMAGQFWVGILLMYDSDSGALTKFQTTQVPAIPSTMPAVATTMPGRE